MATSDSPTAAPSAPAGASPPAPASPIGHLAPSTPASDVDASRARDRPEPAPVTTPTSTSASPDAASDEMEAVVRSAAEAAEHAAREAERLAADAADAVTGLLGGFGWGAAARDADEDADANAPGDEMPDGEASSDADPVAAVAAGFSSLWTAAETAVSDAAAGAESMFTGEFPPAEYRRSSSASDSPGAFAPGTASKKTIENHTALSSAGARVRKRVVGAGELRERFPELPAGSTLIESFACDATPRYVVAPDELVPCAATTVARLPGTLFVTERHVCFESESTSGDSSDEGRKAPSRRLVLAHDEILGVTRSKTEGWIRVEVEVKTPEVEVSHSRGGEGEAGGERGERVSVRKSATFSGFGGDAETEGALALLEHLASSE